jgi:protein tyrosine/serine phosphatase
VVSVCLCSGTPSELNFPFLDQLHLKTVIYLALDEPTETFSMFVQVRSDCSTKLSLAIQPECAPFNTLCTHP